jgi:hypothetical protein
MARLGIVTTPLPRYTLQGTIYKTIIRQMDQRGERRLHVTEMRMLRWMSGVTRMDRIRNEYIRGRLKVAPVTEKMRSNRLD